MSFRNEYQKISKFPQYLDHLENSVAGLRIGLIKECFDQKGLNDSGVGIWASGRYQSGIGVVKSVKRSFWLVADAELVIYGSTDPSAKVTIAGEDVPLTSSGTFRLQVPFRDGLQDYFIEATDFAGNQKRNINMKFERVTPQDNTNPIDKSKSEWF